MMDKKLIYQIKYANHLVGISNYHELIIDGVVQDKDISLPVGIPLLSTATVKGKIRRFTEDDINIRVELRHTGLGTLITIYANHHKIVSQHIMASSY
jgi:hypothetical protein